MGDTKHRQLAPPQAGGEPPIAPADESNATLERAQADDAPSHARRDFLKQAAAAGVSFYVAPLLLGDGSTAFGQAANEGRAAAIETVAVRLSVNNAILVGGNRGDSQ